MNRGWALVFLFSGGCVAHVHGSNNALPKGDFRTPPRDLERPVDAAEDPAALDPGEDVLVMRVSLPAGGGAVLGAEDKPGFLASGIELGLLWGELERSHSEAVFDRVLQQSPLHPAVGYQLQFEPGDRDGLGAGRIYAELQYETYDNEKSPGFGPGAVLGLGPFYEHGSNALGVQASLCGWFLGVTWVRPCVRPALRSDQGFELSGLLHFQGYLEWFSSR